MKAVTHLGCFRMNGNSFSIKKSLLDTQFVKHQNGLIDSSAAQTPATVLEKPLLPRENLKCIHAGLAAEGLEVTTEVGESLSYIQ